MFTGIAQRFGVLCRTQPGEAEIALAAGVRGRLSDGISVAVDGAGLTGPRPPVGPFIATISEEPSSSVSWDRLRTGATGDPESPGPPQTGPDGPRLLGRIDAVGRVRVPVRPRGGGTPHVTYPGGSSRHIVDRGPATVDGIGFTPFAARSGSFGCAVVREVREKPDRSSGDPRSLGSMQAKYVERMIRHVHRD